MMTMLILTAIAAEVIGLIMTLFRNPKISNAVASIFLGSALVCSLFAMLSIGLALIGMFSSLKSFLTDIQKTMLKACYVRTGDQ